MGLKKLVKGTKVPVMKIEKGQNNIVSLLHALIADMKEHGKLSKRKRMIKLQRFTLFRNNNLLHVFHAAVLECVKLICVNVYGKSVHLDKCLNKGWHQDDSKGIRLLSKTLPAVECGMQLQD